MKSHAIICSVALLAVLLLSACGTSKDQQREQRRERREQQIRQVLSMHPEAVAFPKVHFDEEFTIQLQDYFASEPRVFYTVQWGFDVRRDNDEILLTFESWQEGFFQLRCSVDQVSSLLQAERGRYKFDESVVVFTVTEVLRPKLVLASEITDYIEDIPYSDVVFQGADAVIFNGELVGLFPLNDVDEE